MDIKFGGVGISQLLVIFVFVVLGIIVSKVVLNKYPVNGLTDLVNTI